MASSSVMRIIHVGGGEETGDDAMLWRESGKQVIDRVTTPQVTSGVFPNL